MAVMVQRLQCAQLPEVSVLGIGSGPTLKYLVHAQQLIGLSINKTVRGTANLAMHTFFKSDAGRSMEQGGDLVTAFCQGPLTAKIYTHQLGAVATKPSFFVTIEGAKTILNTLPNQDDSVKQRLLTLLHDHLLDQVKATSCLQPASDDQMMVDEDDDCGESLSTIPMAQPINMYRIFAAENRALVAQLKAESDVLRAKHGEVEAKLAKERAEKEAALAKKDVELVRKEADVELVRKEAEIAALKTTAAKDAEIMDLRLQLAKQGARSPRPEHEENPPPKKPARSPHEAPKIPGQRAPVEIPHYPGQSAAKLPAGAKRISWLVAYIAATELACHEVHGATRIISVKVDDRYLSLIRFERGANIKHVVFVLNVLLCVKLTSGYWIEHRSGDKKLQTSLVNLDLPNARVILKYMWGSPKRFLDSEGNQCVRFFHVV